MISIIRDLHRPARLSARVARVREWSRSAGSGICVVLTLWSLVCALPAVADGALKLPTREQVLAAISTFEQPIESSTTPEARADANSVIIAFGEQSDAVEIRISPAAVPWIRGDGNFNSLPDAAIRSLLVTAYFAGNIASQLRRHVRENDSYAGVLAALRTYAQFKQADRTVDIPEVEQLIALEARGELKAYLDKDTVGSGQTPSKR